MLKGYGLEADEDEEGDCREYNGDIKYSSIEIAARIREHFGILFIVTDACDNYEMEINISKTLKRVLQFEIEKINPKNEKFI